ncbi:MAG: ATP-binding cassette domain-containing protein [Betaproteobacteria bacterium]|nr:ATP-binding cassette domain-containing protein [Betaproteobacteria bacterium]
MANLPGFIPPPKGDIAHLARLSRFLAPHAKRIVGALAALIVASACVLALGQGLRAVVDAGLGSRDPAHLNLALAGFVLIAAVLALATWFRFYLMMSTGELVVADLRRAVYGHVLSLSPAYFDSSRTGEIVSRLTNDTTQLQQVIGFGISMFLRNALMSAGALALLFVSSPKLAALIVLGVPATLVPMLLIGRRVRRLSRDNQDRVADVSAHVDESIHEIRTVQAYVHEQADREAFGSAVTAALEVGVLRVRVKAWLIALVMLIGFCAVGLILWIGGQDVLAGRMSAGELSAFVFYAVLVATGAATVSEVWGEIQRAAGATERLMELLDTRAQVALPAAPLPLPARAAGRVRFDAVSFAYPGRPEVSALSSVSFSVSPGEHVALVGPSGAGKSTLFALLMRFYDPQSGSVSIDGVDLSRCDPHEARRQVALVPQEPVIFAASAADNVRYGRPQASLEEVRAACAAAYALEFIERLPRGMDTDLGERGVKLSGGQRQRISIARGLLADRPILLLDEATSSLDAESERVVQMALARLMRGRTTLVIAHRLATVQNAGRILVLDHGRIVAAGTHAELVRSEGLYANLARLQFLAEPQAASA